MSNFLQDGSNFGHQQEKIRQGWSLLSTLHCLLLSGKLVEKGSKTFKKPNVEQLAIRYNNYYSTNVWIKEKICKLTDLYSPTFFFIFRWQDRCLQIRLAAQELLVAELKNLEPKGKFSIFLLKYSFPKLHMCILFSIKGRKHLVELWGAYLPKYGDPPFQNNSNLNNGHR